MSRFQKVSSNLEDVLRREADSRRRRLLLRRPVTRIDALIAALEELHLHDRRRVPVTLADDLQALGRALPADLEHAPLRTGVAITTLLDVLFAVQEELLRRICDADGVLLLDEGADAVALAHAS